MTTQSSRVLQPGDLADLMEPTAQRLEIEIGCGNGHFLTAYGAQHTSTQFVGVDLKMKRCLKTLKKIDAAELNNVEVVCGRAEEVLRKLGRDTVDAFHIYFPDPWPKSRHQGRRLLDSESLDLLLRLLKPGGVDIMGQDVVII